VEVFSSRIEISGKTFLYSIIHDISVRKHAEKALLNSRWRLKSIIEGTHVGTWEWNVQTGETVFNETWADIVGYTLDELSPISIKTWEALAHPDDRKHSGELLEQHFTGELPRYDCECRMKHKDGHWVWVHDCGRVITRTVDDKPLMMFGTHTDITERKQAGEMLQEQAEKALRESEDIYRKAFMTSPDSIFITRLSDGMFVSINKGFTEITGYEEEDIIGKTSLEINIWVNPEDRIKIIEGLQDKGEVRNYEASFLAKDREFYGLMSASIIELNGVPHILNVTRDITDRKQAEDALQSSDSHFRRIVSTVPVMLYDYILYPDGSNRFIYVSPNCYDILEREEKELLQDMDVFWKMVHPDDVECLHREDIAANLTGRTFNVEVRIITKFERMKWVQLSSRPNPAPPGAPTIWSGYVLDITERKQAGEMLQESEEKHKRMIANISDVIAIMDIDGTLRYKSPNIEKWFGWRPEDLVGTDGWETVHPADIERIQKEFFTLLDKDNSVATVEYRYKCKDGSYKMIELTAVNLTNDPVIHGVLMNYHDITARKQAEAEKAQLEAQNRQLQKAESLSRMAAAIAHHFNNQLQAVMGNLEMAMYDLPPGVSPLKSIVSAMEAAHKAAEVSRLMLTYLGQTQTQGNHEPIDQPFQGDMSNY
jgi:PAS domain S-box-containing protein